MALGGLKSTTVIQPWKLFTKDVSAVILRTCCMRWWMILRRILSCRGAKTVRVSSFGIRTSFAAMFFPSLGLARLQRSLFALQTSM